MVHRQLSQAYSVCTSLYHEKVEERFVILASREAFAELQEDPRGRRREMEREGCEIHCQETEEVWRFG